MTKLEAPIKDSAALLQSTMDVLRKSVCVLVWVVSWTSHFLGHDSWGTCARSSWTRKGIRGHGVRACSTLGENIKWFSKALVVNIFLQGVYLRCCESTFSPIFFAQMNGYIVDLIMIFICVFLIIEVGCVHCPYILTATVDLVSA